MNLFEISIKHSCLVEKSILPHISTFAVNSPEILSQSRRPPFEITAHNAFLSESLVAKTTSWQVLPYQPNSSPNPNAYRNPLTVMYIKKVFEVMLRLEAEWPPKQNTLIADTILAESGP